ncbi:DNA primase [Fructilactobacillus florum 8D]|uniref:DNA primase n=1 Tax=Fructilactobacillus florum 8D TaxID=1221538 RepID=W9EFL8_9LACO|nr:DNA primase [Fructilactobacillus florum]ETO40872.1 DNA primase [Fructilactobacillus florum 8D]
MVKIPEETIEKIRSSVNILDIVGQHVQLKKAGKNFFGLCPFHEERTPSFSVNEEKQIFHCFSCGRGGNVFTFLMELEGLSFTEAVQAVGKAGGMQLPDELVQAQQPSAREQQLRPLFSVHEAATRFYHHILVNTKAGAPAREYLKKRQISAEMIETFQLGFAPSERVLQPFFKEQQTDYQTLRKTGLFIENQAGELTDRFVNRLMFPIRNPQGAPIGFSGRLLQQNEQQPKYLNSPETELFNKRKVIYNLDLAKPAVRKTQRLILFEGFMDVISAYQAEVFNGVASMGTSLTEEQIYEFKKVTSQICVCYDGDQPGQKATNRAIDLLTQQDSFEVNVIQMPNGVDPDEFRRTAGPKRFREVISKAQEPALKFKLNFLKTQFNLNNDVDKLNYVNQVLQQIANTKPGVTQDVYLKELSADVDLPFDSLRKQLGNLPDQSRKNHSSKLHNQHSQQAPQLAERHYSRIENAERHLLMAMFYNSSVWDQVVANPNFNFIHDQYQQLYLFAQEYFRTHARYQSAEFSDFVQEPKLQAVLAELEIDNDEQLDNEEAATDCVKMITESAPLVSKINQLRQEFDSAGQIGDELQQLKLASELIRLHRQLDQLRTSND